MKRILLLSLALVVAWYVLIKDHSVSLGPGVHAPEPPRQHTISAASFVENGYSVTPLADFSLTAKVLSRTDYRFDKEADLSPTDLALGWGPMSNEAVLAHFDISQRNRWYYWRSDNLPLSAQQVTEHSANMHIIPANADVARTLKRVRKGDLVSLSGNLVKVKDTNGWQWISSLTRSDSGDGSCELVWVKELSIASTSP